MQSTSLLVCPLLTWHVGMDKCVGRGVTRCIRGSIDVDYFWEKAPPGDKNFLLNILFLWTFSYRSHIFSGLFSFLKSKYCTVTVFNSHLNAFEGKKNSNSSGYQVCNNYQHNTVQPFSEIRMYLSKFSYLKKE